MHLRKPHGDKAMPTASRHTAIRLGLLAAVLANAGSSFAEQTVSPDTAQQLDQGIARVESKVVAWRRDIHQNPELSGQEVRTSKLVADHLRKLGATQVIAKATMTPKALVEVLRSVLPSSP